MSGLAGRVALVTGGSGGIGAAVAAELAARGADVAISGRDPRRMARTAETVRRAGRRALAVPADLRRADEVDRLVDEVTTGVGVVDLLVAAAGVSGPPGVPRPVVQTSLEEWSTVLDTNLRGLFLLCRRTVTTMPSGGGDVVTIVSARAGTAGQPYAAAYSASKMAVAALAAELADDLSPRGIRVQAVFPDAVDTALLAGSTVPGRRLAPARVADLVADLVTAPRTSTMPSPLLTSPGAPWADAGRLEALR